MTDLTSLDLVDRLEERAHYEDNGGVVEKMLFDVGSLLREAATEILRLRALTTPGEGCETRLSLLARWYQRLLACQQENSIVFYPHDSEDGWLATAILDAMVKIDRQRIDLTRETARANAATAERDAWERIAKTDTARLIRERDAALARVAELEVGLRKSIDAAYADQRTSYPDNEVIGTLEGLAALLTKPNAGDQTALATLEQTDG